MKSLSTLFRDVDGMKEMLVPPKWLIGFLYALQDEENDPDIDLGTLMFYFGFDRAYEQFTTYYATYSHTDNHINLASPNHENITLFFEHLKEIGIFKKVDYDPHALEWGDEAESIYKQIEEGTFPKTVNWDMEVPYHPYQYLDGYRS